LRVVADQESSGIQLSSRTVAAGIVTLLALVFVVQNRRRSRIEFLWMDVDVGVWLALGVTFLLGALVGWLATRRS
jgi:uncharacterized integral membrane protein